MVTWKQFAATERDLAETGRSLLLHKSGVGLAFLATVRKDGAPRLHPLCPVLSNDRLFVFITPASPKRHDLLRDGDARLARLDALREICLRETPVPSPLAEACGESRFEVDTRSLLVAQAQEFLSSPELPALGLEPSALFFTHGHTPSASGCTRR